jgi:hypothetical protein
VCCGFHLGSNGVTLSGKPWHGVVPHSLEVGRGGLGSERKLDVDVAPVAGYDPFLYFGGALEWPVHPCAVSEQWQSAIRFLQFSPPSLNARDFISDLADLCNVTDTICSAWRGNL